MSRRNWSARENELTVLAYFEMLELELRHRAFNKAERNRVLVAQLDGRTKGAVELKHMNISAILGELGNPSIDGYKPLPNYQDSLATAVLSYLASHPQHRALVDQLSTLTPEQPYELSLVGEEREVEAPAPVVREGAVRTRGVPLPRQPVDYAEQDARNRQLGELGERFVFNFERARLKRAKRDDLAARVEWSSKERGDGLGYDVKSFGAEGSALFIEVKTTNLGIRTPFIISSSEVDVSEREQASYRLYRVFRFAQDPKFYALAGSVRDSCELIPRSYRATAAG